MSRGQEWAAPPGPLWNLTEGQALRLPAGTHARWLRVTQGRLWLTLSARRPDEVPADCWLRPGDSLALPAGAEAVLEAWPEARFELLAAAPQLSASAWRASRLLAAGWRRLRGWRPAAPAPAGP